MWILAGIVSLFFYPMEDSLTLLAKLGLVGSMGLMALYGAALLDILLGLFLLAGVYIRQVAGLQIALILIYTLALSWIMPSMWADPFGALAKNIPIIVALLVMRSWEE
jgi:hypothetical protein